MTEYPLFAKSITIEFDCPRCRHQIRQVISELPSPNWEGDTVDTSQEVDSEEFQCDNCGQNFEVELFANIYYGELLVRKTDDWKEVEDIDVFDELEERDTYRPITDMRSDLEIFLLEGKAFQLYLERIAIHACYRSIETDIAFSVENITEDRDDYRYDFLRGFLSAMCFARAANPISCSKVAIPSYIGNEVHFVCLSFNNDILAKYKTNSDIFCASKECKLIDDYFTSQFEKNQTRAYFIQQNSSRNEFDISQTSLNDDIFLFSLKCASSNGITELPFGLITQTTPFYRIVEAYGFSEYLKRVVKDHFYCDFDAKNNFVSKITVDEYFDDYTLNALVEKYESNQMYIKDLFIGIENKIDEYNTLISSLKGQKRE